MQYALFEILTGRFQCGKKINKNISSDDIIHSVKDHLTRLLNARKDSLSHMPDYGLPDITQLYQGLPYSQSELSDSIQNLILKYETRLNEVSVFNKSINNGNCILQLEVIGNLISGERVYFDTYFMSGGYADVKYRDAEL